MLIVMISTILIQLELTNKTMNFRMYFDCITCKIITYIKNKHNYTINKV